MKSIGDTIEILEIRRESNFDRACDGAYMQALAYFEIDEDGYSRRVKEWERSCCWIEVWFTGYTRTSGEHRYTFKAKAVKSEE